MRKEREEFRKKLVELIHSGSGTSEEVDADDSGAAFPNEAEKEIMRYYYYIKYGIDTIHVAPMNKKTLDR